MGILLGCIADDFTGATDLANTLVRQGMRSVQTIGVPDGRGAPGDADAVVVALKSRTAPAEDAVRESLAALRWLRDRGARQIFFKYCSTFDSTDRGNIGPVADALLDDLGGEFTIACPAFPANGRAVFKGHLFVGDVLLSESGMQDHPLTPMTDANLARVLSRQTPHRVGLAERASVAAGAGGLAARFAALREDGVRHAIVDAIDGTDLMTIGEACADLPLITGGSGVAMGLPRNFRRQGLLWGEAEATPPASRGAAVVLAGSCSRRTRAQVAAVRDRWHSRRLDPLAIADSESAAANVLSWAGDRLGDGPLLIYSTADPETVAGAQSRMGREEAGALIETTLGRIAAGLVERGARRIVVAGGETSGAVVRALGVTALRIGPEIDPGVPWTETLGEPGLALALKSGNFGAVDFFAKAFEMLPKDRA